MLLNRGYPHGGDIYTNDVELDFSSNTNPFGMPREVREAIIASADFCGVYPDPYCRELRDGIAQAEGAPCDAILCGSGAAELIYSYAYALADSRPALIVEPTFSEYRAALTAAGMRAESYVLSRENGFALTDDILSLDMDRYSAVFVCTPNNPTGLTAEPSVISRIADSGVKVFVDMCFLDLSDVGDIYDIPRLVGAYPNMTALKAFTKSYAMAGVRLGYVMSSDRGLLDSMSTKTQCWNISTVARYAGEAALGCRGWLNATVSEMTAERERMTRVLSSYDLTVFPSRANYILMYSDSDLYSELLKKRILVRDCSNYTGLCKGYVRVAVRTREENDRLLAAIKEVIG